jgi:hypothetical protein
MPFLDTSGLKVVERLPGWKGRFFHTATMTFADYEFTAGSTIHEHFHPEGRSSGQAGVRLDAARTLALGSRCAKRVSTTRTEPDESVPCACNPYTRANLSAGFSPRREAATKARA